MGRRKPGKSTGRRLESDKTRVTVAEASQYIENNRGISSTLTPLPQIAKVLKRIAEALKIIEEASGPRRER